MERKVCAAALAAAALTCGAQAGVSILADTTGQDNFTDASFYGIDFQGGASFIASISYDLSVDADAFFDYDGASSFGDATEPVIDTLVGMNAADVSFDFTAGQSTFLTINFAAGSFGAGDSIRFASDTDFLVSDPAPGSVFGAAGVPITVTLEDGTTLAGNFEVVSDRRSEATFGVIPAPGALALFGLACLGTRRRRN